MGDHVELVVDDLGVPAVVAHPLRIRLAHVHGHVRQGVGVAVVRRQRLHELRPRFAVLPGRGKQHGLLRQVREDRQVAMAFRPGHLIDAHAGHVGHVDRRMRLLDVRLDHSPHPGVLLAQDLGRLLHGHLPHQGQRKRFKLLCEVLGPAFPWRGHPPDFAALRTPAPRQVADNLRFLVEHVQMTPSQPPDMVVADHARAPVVRTTFLVPQLRRFPHVQFQRLLGLVERRPLDHPCIAQSQQLAKQFFRCRHAPETARIPRFWPLELAKNQVCPYPPAR